jgi:hypothetical protein
VTARRRDSQNLNTISRICISPPAEVEPIAVLSLSSVRYGHSDVCKTVSDGGTKSFFVTNFLCPTLQHSGLVLERQTLRHYNQALELRVRGPDPVACHHIKMNSVGASRDQTLQITLYVEFLLYEAS